jgi:hypothetical protein
MSARSTRKACRSDARAAAVGAIEYSARSCLAVDAGKLRGLKQGEGFVLGHLVSPLPPT